MPRGGEAARIGEEVGKEVNPASDEAVSSYLPMKTAELSKDWRDADV